MKQQPPTQTVDSLIKSIRSKTVVPESCHRGYCWYVLVDGVYQRYYDGCKPGCTCPQTLPIPAALRAVVGPPVIREGQVGAVVCCTAATAVEDEPSESERTELVELFKLLLGGYRFWRLASLGLGALSVVLVGVVVYLLARG